VGDAEHGRQPADPVAVDVAGARRVDDRVHDVLGDLVADDEGQVRLRQEPRLEDAAAVLVRDALLAPVPDRLDHRHADVSRVLLDRLHDRLDAVSHDHGLHLDHPSLTASRSWTTKKAPPLAIREMRRRCLDPGLRRPVPAHTLGERPAGAQVQSHWSTRVGAASLVGLMLAHV
jgi:hypothetical protein